MKRGRDRTEMNEKESDGEAALLPRLPNEVVLFHVISRLPWYARPVCRALSKAWTLWIDSSTKRPDILIQSRQHLLPLLRSHFLFCTFDHRTFIDEACHGPRQERRSEYDCIQSRDQTDQICKEWRELPSLLNYFPQMHSYVTLLATDGMVYVRATRWEPQQFVLKMDFAAGDWTWKKLPVSGRISDNVITFNRKIYVPTLLVTGQEGGMVVVHDMTTEEVGLAKTRNQINLRVLRNKISDSSSGLCEEELYSFVKRMAVSESGPKLEIFIYDACNDSWMTKFMLPMPVTCPHVKLIKLANRDCFEPVPDGGINTVWHDPNNSVVSWFNPSLHETWIDFNYNAFLLRGRLERLEFIHSCLYGIFVGEGEYDTNCIEEETNPPLYKHTIMKGKMVVETSNVQWEEVLDIGCFQDSYYRHTDNYTFMA